MSDAAAEAPPVLSTFHMSIITPGIGLISVDCKSPSLIELIEFWWERGYVDGHHAESGMPGRFSRDNGSHFLVRAGSGPKGTILVPK